VRLGIRPVRGKVGGYGIDFTSDPIKSRFDPIKSRFDPIKSHSQRDLDTVNFVAQHLMPFNDDIQLVLKILGHYANMVLENFFDLLYIAGIH